MRAARVATDVAALRWASGAALLAAPVRDPATRRFCRVLGVRHVAEAAFLRTPTPARCLAGAGVDAAHAASVLWLARRRPGHARALHANAALAIAFAAAGVWRAATRP